MKHEKLFSDKKVKIQIYVNEVKKKYMFDKDFKISVRIFVIIVRVFINQRDF